jgi:hypothetical protein
MKTPIVTADGSDLILRRMAATHSLAMVLIAELAAKDTRWDFSAEGIAGRAFDIAEAFTVEAERRERAAVDAARMHEDVQVITLREASLLAQAGETDGVN